MWTWYRRLGLLACGLAVLMFAVAGCKKREHRTMRVHEEERHGPVQEEKPGEMVVE